MNEHEEALRSMNIVVGQFLSRLARAVASLLADEDPRKNTAARLEKFQKELDWLVRDGRYGSETQLSENQQNLLLGFHAGFLDTLDLALKERKF